MFNCNGIKLNYVLYSHDVCLSISRPDSFLVLVNIFNGIRIDFLDNTLICKEIKANKIKFSNEYGHKGVINRIKNIYIQNHIDVNDEIRKLNDLILTRRSFNNIDSFLDKTNKFVLIINGTNC